MIDEAMAATFASACDTILPGSSAKGVHEQAAKLFEAALPGFSFVVVGLLDAFAAEVEAGRSFTEIDGDARGKVFDLMAAETSTDIRDAIDGLFLFTLGMNYAEALPGYQQVWDGIGYHGPSKGVPGLA